MDRRRVSPLLVSHRLTDEACQRILHRQPAGVRTTAAGSDRAGPADRGVSTGSETTSVVAPVGCHGCRPGDMAVPLPGDRRLEPQGGGPHLPGGMDQQGPPPAIDPPCRQRQCHTRRQPRSPAGGAGGAQILLQSEGQQRQPLLRTAAPHGQVQAGRPQTAIPQPGEGLRLGLCITAWYDHQYRHGGQAEPICSLPARVCAQARQPHPRRWSRTTRCWRQPEVVWINPPPPENDPIPATLARAA